MSMFHERLRELKDRSGQTQQRIASDLKLTPQALSYYINGREPSFDLLLRFADYFGVTVDYLLGRSAQPTPGDEYIYNTTGLQHDAIMALKKMKKCLTLWDDTKAEKLAAIAQQFEEELDINSGSDQISEKWKYFSLSGYSEYMFKQRKLLDEESYMNFRSLFFEYYEYIGGLEFLDLLNQLIRFITEDVSDENELTMRRQQDMAATSLLQALYDFMVSPVDKDDPIWLAMLNRVNRSGQDVNTLADSLIALKERRILDALWAFSKNYDKSKAQTFPLL